MKKIVSFVLVFAMLFCLCACSEKNEEVKEEEFVPQRGSVEGNLYKNEAFGVSFSSPEGWYYYTDEEIAQTVGVTMDEMFTEDFAQAVENTEIIYDMYCTNPETGDTVSVNIENLGVMYGLAFDEDAYLASAAVQFESQMEAAGVNLTKNEAGTVIIDGKVVPCLYVTMEVYGVSIYEVIPVKKVGNWMVTVTFGSLSEASLEELAAKLSFE